MLFTTWHFALFLPVVLIAYYALAHRWQNYLLLAASYFFYGCWDWRFLLLLMFSTCTDYLCGLGIESGPQRRKKLLLGLTLAINLSILGFFKYFNFFVDSAGHLLTAGGFHANLPVLKVILPVGVSFYTFQSISYVVDVYRGKAKAERDFLLYALFVSYFPQLVAGPIERAAHMLPQYRNPRIVDNEKFSSGLMLILLGLFKKLAIADAVAEMVSHSFDPAHVASYPATELLKGIWLFAIQIYCDFSGYTDIARGTSRLLGIELMENFNQPYLSHNITEFWRRWHISLSTWLRDYLYIPLGGNRQGTLATYRNLFITMVLGGLWHGANWTYVAWGALHGLFLAGHKLFMQVKGEHGRTGTVSTMPGLPGVAASFAETPPRPIKRPDSPPKRWDFVGIASMILTLHCVLLAWVFFRAPNFATAWSYLHGILIFRGGLEGFGPRFEIVAFYVLLMLLIDVPQYIWKNHTILLRSPWPARGIAMASIVLLIILLAPNNDTPFIYFQF